MLARTLQWLGFGLCHQLPERSFFGGGVQVPVCARDTGIYVGFMIALAAIAIIHRPLRPRDFPDRWGWGVLGVFVAAMGFDGVSSYAGWRTTTNDLRLLTGIMAGFAAAAVIAPILNDELWVVSSPTRVLAPWKRLLSWVGLVPVSFVLIRWGGPLLGVGYPLLVALAIISTYVSVNLAIVGMWRSFDRRAEKVTALFVPILISLLLSVVEIQMAAMLRAGIFAFATSLR